jgi:hypothetical protein
MCVCILYTPIAHQENRKNCCCMFPLMAKPFPLSIECANGCNLHFKTKQLSLDVPKNKRLYINDRDRPSAVSFPAEPCKMFHFPAALLEQTVQAHFAHSICVCWITIYAITPRNSQTPFVINDFKNRYVI